MDAVEFETKLSEMGFYFIRPSLISWTVDSDFLTCDDMLIVITNNQSDISSCVRKRSEQVGKTSFYFRNRAGNQYFKVVADNAIQTGGNYMEYNVPEWAKDVAMYAVSGFLMGFTATVFATPQNWMELSNAIYGACVLGCYQAVKSVGEYLIKKSTPNTKAGKAEAPKPLIKRML